MLLALILLIAICYLSLGICTASVWTALWKDFDREPGPREQILIGLACPIVFPIGCIILFVMGAYAGACTLFHGLVHDEW